VECTKTLVDKKPSYDVTYVNFKMVSRFIPDIETIAKLTCACKSLFSVQSEIRNRIGNREEPWIKNHTDADFRVWIWDISFGKDCPNDWQGLIRADIHARPNDWEEDLEVVFLNRRLQKIGSVRIERDFLSGTNELFGFKEDKILFRRLRKYVNWCDKKLYERLAHFDRWSMSSDFSPRRKDSSVECKQRN
jgi:hypothetical protein